MVSVIRGTAPSGCGYGSGYGSGSGSGDGYGDGSGCGDGYGSSYGSGDYWLRTIPAHTRDWTAAQLTRLRELSASARLAFWWSDAEGLPVNGGERLELAAPGVIHRANGPLMLCQRGTLHATLLPPKWQGERLWIVALHGDVIGDEEKFGCLEREILGECALGAR